MRVFVDTSALYAILDEDDLAHARAAATWRGLLDGSDLVTSNYVTVEASELLRRRLGRDAVTRLVDSLLPSLEPLWIDEPVHTAALEACRSGGWRTSLVDQTSFLLMRRLGVDVAFAFDRDFEQAGFQLAEAPRPPRTRRFSESTTDYGVLSGDTDLVGIAEVASRSGRPVSTIQSWRRRHADFPVPSAQLASGPVWSWPTVDSWIRAVPRRTARVHASTA